MTPQQREAAIAGPDAAAWIEAAANYGLVEAQLLFGQTHLATDRGLALRWFRAAAGAGYAPALNMVGRCLENGWGTTPNLEGAARHYRTAAEKGHDWAQFNLANLLLYGLGLPRDRPAAYAWYANAAAQNHAKAMNMLGRFHEEGWDRPRDLETATHWYRRAATAGDCRAQFNLATILQQRGQTAKARALLQSALATGHPGFKAEVAAALTPAAPHKTTQTRSPGRAAPPAGPSSTSRRQPE